MPQPNSMSPFSTISNTYLSSRSLPSSISPPRMKRGSRPSSRSNRSSSRRSSRSSNKTAVKPAVKPAIKPKHQKKSRSKKNKSRNRKVSPMRANIRSYLNKTILDE